MTQEVPMDPQNEYTSQLPIYPKSYYLSQAPSLVSSQPVKSLRKPYRPMRSEDHSSSTVFVTTRPSELRHEASMGSQDSRNFKDNSQSKHIDKIMNCCSID
jgi:hypothetical protein